jgi:A/G-specific adenine glycosylase
MQQTRIEQGAPYYLRFISKYPDVTSLAAAPIDDVLLSWEGLGYYTRARNLHKAAFFIVNHLDGKFPASYEGLLDLPGIGSYSAAAIASFAYGLPYPVVDGNVKRLIARYEGIASPVDTPAIHEEIRRIAAFHLKKESPAAFNQAIMNFGALVCKPRNPSCPLCPLQKKCFAFQHDRVNSLPVKAKTKSNRVRFFHFIVLHYRDSVLFERRDSNDIWKGLYTLPGLESGSSRKPALHLFLNKIKPILGHNPVKLVRSTGLFSQPLSHQTIQARFHHFSITEKPARALRQQKWIKRKTADHLAKPKIILDWLKNDAFAFSGSDK